MKKKIMMIGSIAIIISILIALIGLIAWENKAIELNSYLVTSERLPSGFDGFRIAQISDFHNAEFKNNNEKLIALTRDANPDIIVITGDMIDSRTTNVEAALSLATELVNIAPCYYVTGNHESRIPEYLTLSAGLSALGVYILENSKLKIERGGDEITILGVNDPDFIVKVGLKSDEETEQDEKRVIDENLNALMQGEEGFTVLLSHRPELFDIYVKNRVDLAISGHAHGGQFRLPVVGGVYAPHQGLFPKYDSGVFNEGRTSMVVSRGIGDSLFPFRLNNRPEIVLIELISD